MFGVFVCCVLFGANGLSFVNLCCLLRGVRCLLCDVCCLLMLLLFVICCLLFADCCSLADA